MLCRGRSLKPFLLPTTTILASACALSSSHRPLWFAPLRAFLYDAAPQSPLLVLSCQEGFGRREYSHRLGHLH
ncbi:hypothetical protein DFH06DRAFT_1171083 [Mycena polygramma]|nr:hypothetical protein DFH06DRAFT_1176591 [Mycena polygramma]KAJ7675961.1 hypothetical protein DFH06DRAFT_1171083 [Mycena polygramma]